MSHILCFLNLFYLFSVAKQAKALKKKLQMYGSDEEDEEDNEDDSGEEDGKLWGAKKSEYYKEDEVSSAE